MTIHAMVSGTLSGNPTARTTAAGKPWATLKLATGDQGLAAYVSVSVFSPDVVDAILALSDGAAVSLQGRLEVNSWAGRDGAERQGLGLVATALIALDASPRVRRSAKPARPPQAQPDGDAFGPDAGDLDGILPAAGSRE